MKYCKGKVDRLNKSSCRATEERWFIEGVREDFVNEIGVYSFFITLELDFIHFRNYVIDSQYIFACTTSLTLLTYCKGKMCMAKISLSCRAKTGKTMYCRY